MFFRQKDKLSRIHIYNPLISKDACRSFFGNMLNSSLDESWSHILTQMALLSIKSTLKWKSVFGTGIWETVIIKKKKQYRTVHIIIR